MPYPEKSCYPVNPRPIPGARNGLLVSVLTNYAAKIITLASGFVMTPFMLHRLGQDQFGLWVLVASVVAYGGLLDFGISSAVIKYVARYRAECDDDHGDAKIRVLIATAVRLSCGLGLLCVLLSMLLAPFFPDWFGVPAESRITAQWLVGLMGLALGISIPCAIPGAILRGLRRFDLSNVLAVIGLAASTLMTVLVLLAGYGLLTMVVLNIVITLLMQVPTLLLLRRAAPDLRLSWRGAQRDMVRNILSFSSSVFIIDVAGRMQGKTDEIVVAGTLPIGAVAPYNIARRLSEIAQMLTDQFMKVLLPMASSLHAEKDTQRLQQLFIVSTRLTLAIFVPVAAVVVVLARALLTVWVGPAFADYAPLVLVLTLASLIETSTWPAGSVMQGMGRHRHMAYMALGSGVANLIISIALAKILGVIGVALGTLIPTSIECLCFIMPYALRTLNVSPRQFLRECLIPALVPAAPMLLVLFGIQSEFALTSLLSIAVAAGLGALVYGLSYLGMDVNRRERQICRDLVVNSLPYARLRRLWFVIS